MQQPTFVEVSHIIEPGMETFRGLPVPEQITIVDHESSRDELFGGQSEFLIASLHLCGNTGTYVDAPLHRFKGGTDLADLSLESLAHLDVVVVNATDYGSRGIQPDALAGLDVSGKAVLFHTGWSVHWRTDTYFQNNPFLPKSTCELLVKQGARFVGIDSLNIDDVQDLARPAHTTLLGAGIPVCEHMTNLAAVPNGSYLHAVPIAWKGGATFPVRAYVCIPQ
ncbi:MAG: arylformamidase [Planctomycetota bacterium]|jgi:arylformamidase